MQQLSHTYLTKKGYELAWGVGACMTLRGVDTDAFKADTSLAPKFSTTGMTRRTAASWLSTVCHVGVYLLL